MHVLRQIHKALRPNGILLDVHPQPEDPRVEIVHEHETQPVGTIDWTQDSRDIRSARRRLSRLQAEGLFQLDRRVIFEVAMYHDSVDSWLTFRRERGATSVLTADLLRAARRRMRKKGSRLVVRERVRATTFWRV